MNYVFGIITAMGMIFLTVPGNAENLTVSDITASKAKLARSQEFEKDLTQLDISAKLNCTHLISISNENGQESFGGICDMTIANKKPETIMLCNDTMIGMLTVKASGFSIDKAALTSFTQQNCNPGE